MQPFEVSSIALTRKDPESGAPLTANVYRLEGVNGGRDISLGQLVMALCLARATELERKIIEIMATMDATTDRIERLSAIEEKLVNGQALDDGESTYLKGLNIAENVTDIEAALDSLNSFSQETMIDLQSQTNKRDQAYDMAANMMKSLNGVQIGIANNM